MTTSTSTITSAGTDKSGENLTAFRVLNLRLLCPQAVALLGERLVYAGRPTYRSRHSCARTGSPWGNPFRGAGSLAKYRAHVLASPALLAMLPTLRGKVLACWCCNSMLAPGEPRVCHAEVLGDLVDLLASP